MARVSGASSRRRSARRRRPSATAPRKASRSRYGRPPTPAARSRARAPPAPVGRGPVAHAPSATSSGRPAPAQRRRPRRAGRRAPGPRAAARAAAPGTARPRRHRDHDRRDQLAVGPGEDGLGRAVVRPASAWPARGGPASSSPSGARTSRPSAAGPARIRFANRSPVVLDEPDGPLDDRRRAAVVDLEVDPPQPGQRRIERRGRAGRRRAASRRSTGRRRRRGRSGSPAPRAAAPAGAGPGRRPGPRRRGGGRSRPRQRASSGRVGLEPRDRARGRGRRSRGRRVAATAALVGDEGPRDRTRRPGRRRRRRRVDPQLELQPRDRRRRARRARPSSASGHELAQHGGAVGERSTVDAGIAEDLAARARGTSGRGRRRARRRAAPGAASSRSPSSTAARLLNVIAAMVSGGDAVVDEPGDARDEGRRLALSRPARRTATGPGRRGRGRSLVGREPGEPLGDHGWVHRHAREPAQRHALIRGCRRRHRTRGTTADCNAVERSQRFDTAVSLAAYGDDAPVEGTAATAGLRIARPRPSARVAEVPTCPDRPVA